MNNIFNFQRFLKVYMGMQKHEIKETVDKVLMEDGNVTRLKTLDEVRDTFMMDMIECGLSPDEAELMLDHAEEISGQVAKQFRNQE